ncbi:MAG: glutamine synthetase family protein [Pleomorphochaeta sp.]
MGNMQYEISNFIEENNVKFIRLAFCDIYGNLKNISISSDELDKAFDSGISFDASSVKGFLNVEKSDLMLFPDPETLQILPWRPSSGKVVMMYCDIKYPDNTPFEGDGRYLIKNLNKKIKKEGLSFKIGSECEFYLFKLNEQGNPSHVPLDNGTYLDFAPKDKGENIRRDICLTLQEMGFHTERSHHENGPGQMEIDFSYSNLLNSADNLTTFKSVVKSTASLNGLFASFLPKPIEEASGNGLHVNISIRAQEAVDNSQLRKYMIGGILKHSKEISIFTSPIYNSYQRLGRCEAPNRIGWGYENRSTTIRIPRTKGKYNRLEVRNPDTSANPYITFTLICEAALEGIINKIDPPEPIDINAFENTTGEFLPKTMEEAIDLAKNSEFLKRVLPQKLIDTYLALKTDEVNEYKECNETKKLTEEKYFPIY